jgi:hypothetical protein
MDARQAHTQIKAAKISQDKLNRIIRSSNRSPEEVVNFINNPVDTEFDWDHFVEAYPASEIGEYIKSR